jgi:hypothetical protein
MPHFPSTNSLDLLSKKERKRERNKKKLSLISMPQGTARMHTVIR